jgi:hypothetical protein
MQETVENKPTQIEPEPLTRVGFFIEILNGIGVMLGLALLWFLEGVRNSFFRLLDRMNVKARARKGSAFPPGRPRRTQA